MSAPRIVGFCGPMGVGKSTAAMALVSRGWIRMSFADPLREMLVALGVPREALKSAKEVPLGILCGKTPRHALQTLGTEWGRQMIGQDIWAQATLARIQAAPAPVVLDDCRFDNEARIIREAGGCVVELVRTGYGYSSGHASESGVSRSLIDYTICAETQDELFTQIKKLEGIYPWHAENAFSSKQKQTQAHR